MNLKKDLLKKLNAEFYDKIYSRGKKYYAKGRVGDISVEEGRNKQQLIIRGKVHGNRMYDVRLFFDLQTCEFETFACDCPYTNDDNCKHMVALGLKFIDIFSEFSQNGTRSFKKSEFKNYLKNRKSAKKSSDPVGELRRLFDAGENRSTKEIMQEAKKILSVDSKSVKFVSNNHSNNFVPPEPKPQRNAINIDDFYLAIKFKHNKIDIVIRKNGVDYETFGADYFLERKSSLSSKQIELMEYLFEKKTGQDNPDPMDLLLLTEKSEMKYYEVDNYGTKIVLAIIDNQKLNLGVKLIDNSRFVEDIERETVEFKLEVTLKDIENKEIYFAEKGMIFKDGEGANICYLSKYTLDFLRRTKKNILYYRREKNEKAVRVNLEEDEIVDINQVISDLKNSFKLTTKLPDKFEIKKYKEHTSKILVDYDCEQQLLEVRVVVDYGLEKQDVGQSVYPARIRNENGKTELRWRKVSTWNSYIIRRSGNLIELAKIEKDKEIDLFRTFYEDLDKTGFSKTLKLHRKGDEAIADFYASNWLRIIAFCKKNNIIVEFSNDNLEIETADFRADFKVDLDAMNDWLAFDVDCYCGEGKITLDVLREYVASGRKFVKKDGKLIRIANREELEKLIKMLESFHQEDDQKFEGKVYHAPELEDVIGSEYYNLKISKSFSRFVEEAQNGHPVEKVSVPLSIKKTLRDYQKDGLDWLYFLRKYRFGGILADDMGLGKTLQALSLIEMNKVKNKPSLVVCPKTLLFNWEDEVVKFFPKMKTLVIQGNPKERREKLKEIKNFDLIITSYPAVKKDEKEYAELKFNYCFLDEAQFIKNNKTQNARAVKKINADYRVALTGTPLENSVAEIWSIFDFLMPGFLGKRKDFLERFEKPIMKQSDVVVMQTLKKKIACFMLRRTKEKVLKELPAKIEQASHCQMTGSQNILYQEILANVKSEIFETVKIKGFSKSQIHILAGLTKLRQVCNHPVLLLKDKNHEKYKSAKLDLFHEITEEIISSGRKVLVFSQFTGMLDILSKELKKSKIDHHYLSGKTKNRKELVNDFNKNPTIQVFLISLKAGGTGLNLTSADNVIIFDPWWNPSVENQAIDRVHRIGQKKTVNVYRLITKGTIEEKIVALQEKKKFLFDSLVGESNDLFKKLTWDDVKDLFKD